MEKKRIGKEQARLSIRRFCAYQERAQQEVRDKLYELGMTMDEVEEIMSDLISENFFFTNERECKLILDSIEVIGQAHINFLIEWSKL